MRRRGAPCRVHRTHTFVTSPERGKSWLHLCSNEESLRVAVQEPATLRSFDEEHQPASTNYLPEEIEQACLFLNLSKKKYMH